jgi:site-specific DNA recombinase
MEELMGARALSTTDARSTRPLPQSAEDLRGLRAARWVRESTAGQYANYGPDSQRKLQDRALVSLGMSDSGLAWEPAQSGSTVYQGPAMASVLEAARAGAFDVLVVAYVDRWQRNLRQTLNVLEDALHPAGVVVWFCDEEILSSNDRAWDQLVDRAKAAESWLRLHRKRVREGLAAKLTMKRDPSGHPPFGFRRNEAKLVEPDPERAQTVRAVFEASAMGRSDREVAAQTGISLYRVRGMLTSPLYIGQLRDGDPASWGPLVDLRIWNRVQEVRARRATNAGRPAAPRRPYALSMLHCAACGRHLIGDTGYYRHPDACAAFRAATPEWPYDWHGRRDGKGYRRTLYEDAIGKVLEQVQLGADVLVDVVSDVSHASASIDSVAIARIERERDAAIGRYRRDRDARALEVAMARLDAQEAEARRELEPEVVPAPDAHRYLQELPATWRALENGEGPGRRMLAEALFDRLDVLGFRELVAHPTAHAVARGMLATLPQQMDITVGYGRGERSSASSSDVQVVRFVEPSSEIAEATQSA